MKFLCYFVVLMLFWLVLVSVFKCSGTTLVNGQVPTKPIYHSLPSIGQKEKVQKLCLLPCGYSEIIWTQMWRAVLVGCTWQEHLDQRVYAVSAFLLGKFTLHDKIWSSLFPPTLEGWGGQSDENAKNFGLRSL